MTGPHVTSDRSAISAARHRFFVHVADHTFLPGLRTLAETVEQWWDGIEVYLTTGTTNAASSNSKRVTPSASATARTNACNHAAQPLDGSDERHTPTKSEDP